MKVTMHDGAVFEGRDAKAIVRQMKHADWGAPPKKQAYMVEVAERLADLGTTQVIRTHDAGLFLFDLAVAGLCRVED